METGMNQTWFLIVLLSLSVMLSGCSSQLYTALVSSEDELSRSLASLVGSSPTGEQVSRLSQSEAEAPLPGGANVGLDIPVEGPPLARLSDSSIEPSLVQRGQIQEETDLQTHASHFAVLPNPQPGSDSAFLPGMNKDREYDSRGEFRSVVTQEGANESLSSSSDDITPLDAKDLLTEMAAASGKSTSLDFQVDPFSTGRKGTTLDPLGVDLFGEGNLGDVFFDFDAVAIRMDAESTLQANAKILKIRFEDRHVVIEGHCDERGTAEYNLVLGERRAQTTKQYLVDLGVSSSAIQTISYGNEKPFCTASRPDCWKMNRRGHFVVQ